MTALDHVHVGQWALAMGNPFGLASLDGRSSLTYGIVSALGKSLPELEEGVYRIRLRLHTANRTPAERVVEVLVAESR